MDGNLRSSLRATPDSLRAISEKVPEELRKLSRWVAWDGRLTDAGRVSKAPLNPATGGIAKTNRPETWASFESALQFAQRDSRVGGLGLVLTDGDYWALDLDHVVDKRTGEIEPEASRFLASLGPAYIEQSPSGDGLHVIFRGKRPSVLRQSKIKDAFGIGRHLEIFGGKSSRYLTMTGQVLGSATPNAVTREAVSAIGKLLPSKQVASNPQQIQPSVNLDVEERKVRRALRNVPSADYDDWVMVGMALRATFPDDQGFSIWLDWSSKANNFESADCDAHWRSFNSPEGGVGLGSVYRLANQHEPDWRAAWRSEDAVCAFGQPTPNSAYLTQPGGARGNSVGWGMPESLNSSEPPMPFPLGEVIPESCRQLGEFVAAVAASLQVPVDMPAMLALAAFGLALSRTIEVSPGTGWREQVCLYVLILLKSVERKSAAFSKMIDPIYEWQRATAVALAERITIAENEILVAEEKLKKARTKAAAAAKHDRTPLDLNMLAQELATLRQGKPIVPSLIATESTTEAIADMLIENGERGMLAAPEGDALDVMLGRYSQGKPNLGLWLSGHAGDAVEIRRKNRPTVRLRRPALTVALAVQPEAVSDLFESKAAAGRGLLARFFFCSPDSKLGYRDLTPPPVPPGLSEWYTTRIRRMLNRPVPKSPIVLELAEDASQLFLAFRQQLEDDLRPEGRFAERSAWGSKLAGAVARVAGILHGIAHPDLETHVVSAETLRGALALAPYLDAHERDAACIILEDPAVRIAKRILAWVCRKKIEQFSYNECFNAVRTSALNKTSQIDPALQLLIERGWLRAVPPTQDERNRGRPPSPCFLVHPLATDAAAHRQATQNTQNTTPDRGDTTGSEFDAEGQEESDA